MKGQGTVDNAIKKEFSLSRQVRLLMVVGVAAFFGVSVFIYSSMYSCVGGIVHRHATNSIANISQLNVDSVSRSVQSRRSLLNMICKKLMQEEVREKDRILWELKDYVEAYDFYNMGIMDENRRLYLTDGRVLDVSGIPQYEAAWDQKFHLSDSFLPAEGGEYAVNMFSYPFFYRGELKYVLAAAYRSSNLTERMNINSMGGKGYTFIVNGGGEIAVYPRYYEDEEYSSLMAYINERPEIIVEKSGERYFEYNGERYYAHFEPLDINGWYLLTCARASDVFAEANRIMLVVFAGMGLLWLMVIVAVFATVFLLYRSRKELRKAVFYDDMVGIGNSNAIPAVFHELSEEERCDMALVVFDIDRFKEFNYIYGEDAGDALLKYIVRAFREELPGEYLFRQRSDHFVAMIHCADQHEFIIKMDKFIARCTEDMEEGLIQPFDLSAGVRRMHAGDSYRRVVSDALIAKSSVKGIQLQKYAFYDEKTMYKRMSYMEMESDFARALRKKEFKVFYQPKYDMNTGKIVGSEALVRWVKADGTIVSPGEFIPCFEASRQIILLDEAMLESVCCQMKEMEEAGLDVKKVSVNLSRVHLRHSGILSKIEKIIKESGVNPAKLSFEITESALYEDSIPLKTIVDFLHNLGCRVDMDDYGIGVSGPNALATNAFDVVKMDKSFIDGIGDQRMEAVIKSTISLSQTLGMEILAEGVEKRHQAERLIEWGCIMAQGFYYSPPVPEEEYRRLLSASG